VREPFATSGSSLGFFRATAVEAATLLDERFSSGRSGRVVELIALSLENFLANEDTLEVVAVADAETGNRAEMAE
jgi:hypothetical protein